MNYIKPHVMMICMHELFLWDADIKIDMTYFESDSLGGALGSGHCWAKPARATPKGVIAPILRNDMTLRS